MAATAFVADGFRRDPFNVTQSEFFEAPEDQYTTQTYGFTLGGPIVKDKLRFFAGYMPERYQTDRSINFVTAAGVVSPKDSSSTVLRHRGTGRIDYSPFQKLQINASYFWNPQKKTGVLTSNDAKVAPPTSDLTKQGGYVPSNATTLGANYLPSSKLLFSARYGYRYLNDKGDTYGKDDVPFFIYQSSTTGLTGVPPQWQQAARVSERGQHLRDAVGPADASQRLPRRHVLRQRVRPEPHDQGGLRVEPHRQRRAQRLHARPLQHLLGRGFLPRSVQGRHGDIRLLHLGRRRPERSVFSRNQGLFVQDSWRVARTLTLNLGIRFENEYLPPFKDEVNGVKVAKPISFSWGDKIAPRIGAAWDILGDGRWKMSAASVTSTT